MNKQHKKPRRDDMYEADAHCSRPSRSASASLTTCARSPSCRRIEQRYQVAVYLSQGMIYNDILERTGATSATISRVNRSLQYGADGYAVAFERLKGRRQVRS